MFLPEFLQHNHNPLPLPCPEWEEKLAALHPDDLSPADRQALNTHVASCERCTATLTDYHTLDALICDTLIMHQPLDLWEELVADQPQKEVALLASTPNPLRWMMPRKRVFLGKIVQMRILVAVLIATILLTALITIQVIGISHFMVDGVATPVLTSSPPAIENSSVPMPSTSPIGNHTLLVLLPPAPHLLTPPSSPDQALIEKRVWYYITLVFDGHSQEAYSLLSPDVRAQESFSDFKQNQNYTLFQGCWRIDSLFPSQSGSQEGIVSVELTNVSCDNNSSIASFEWILHLRLEDREPVITSIGLYPAEPGP